MNHVFMQFQNDVMTTANNMAVQEMCIQNGIDFTQKLAQAQLIEHQKVMAYQQQKMMDRAYAEYYGRGQKTSFFGKIKDVFFDQEDRLAAEVQRRAMMNQIIVPVQPMQVIQQEQVVQPAQPVEQAQQAQVAQPAQQDQAVEQEQVENEEIPFEDDARIQKLEQEVGSIKNDISELKDSMAQLLAAIKG